jgi:hypothetical protein
VHAQKSWRRAYVGAFTLSMILRILHPEGLHPLHLST